MSGDDAGRISRVSLLNAHICQGILTKYAVRVQVSGQETTFSWKSLSLEKIRLLLFYKIQKHFTEIS